MSVSKKSAQGTLGLDLFETVSQETKVDNAFEQISSKGVKTLYMPPSLDEAIDTDNQFASQQGQGSLVGAGASTSSSPASAVGNGSRGSAGQSLVSSSEAGRTQAKAEEFMEVAMASVHTGQVSLAPKRGDSGKVEENLDYDPFEPLASRMRPRTIDEYIGQSHLLGPDKPLRKALERHRCQSMILWGPPGVGKTTLALMLAKATGAVLEQLSAVVCGMADIREAVARAKERRRHGVRTILFVDEVHRFNKLQQDAFLPHVEDGTIIFVGATTENPSFQVNSALLSRARVFVLKKLTEEELGQLLDLTLNSERGLKKEHLVMDERVRQALIGLADGDARHLLTTLEMLADDAADLKDGRRQITYAMVGAIAGRRLLSYDKNGDAYYDLISAFHKSVRGSAPDAALYWYARILEAGGDPSYVARRILAIATEDVGLADPNAMQIALNAWDIFNRVGAAEGERAIAEAAVYMALAPKSNHLYAAFNQVRKDVVSLPSYDVPLYIRNAPTKLMSELGYHAGYRYAHDFPGAYAPGECFMPEELHGRRYYYPSERGFEAYLKAKQAYLQQRDQAASPEEQRFKAAHAQQVQTNLKHRYPDLFVSDLAAAADAEPASLGYQISPQPMVCPVPVQAWFAQQNQQVQQVQHSNTLQEHAGVRSQAEVQESYAVASSSREAHSGWGQVGVGQVVQSPSANRALGLGLPASASGWQGGNRGGVNQGSMPPAVLGQSQGQGQQAPNTSQQGGQYTAACAQAQHRGSVPHGQVSNYTASQGQSNFRPEYAGGQGAGAYAANLGQGGVSMAWQAQAYSQGPQGNQGSQSNQGNQCNQGNQGKQGNYGNHGGPAGQGGEAYGAVSAGNVEQSAGRAYGGQARQDMAYGRGQGQLGANYLGQGAGYGQGSVPYGLGQGPSGGPQGNGGGPNLQGMPSQQGMQGMHGVSNSWSGHGSFNQYGGGQGGREQLRARNAVSDEYDGFDTYGEDPTDEPF